MGKKRKKREKNFPRHVVTGVAVTSLAFGVLTNASGIENLFKPQNYKQFEEQLKDKASDYAAGKGKDTDLADKKNKNHKNSGDNLSQALKMAQNTRLPSTDGNLHLTEEENSNTDTKNPNAVAISDTNGNDTINTNPTTSTDDNDPSSPSDHNTSNDSDHNATDTSDQTTNSSDSNESSKIPEDNTDHKQPSSSDEENTNDDFDKITDWEKEQLIKKDTETTKYGIIKKLEATITKDEYSLGARFSAEDAIVTGTFEKDGKTYKTNLPYGGEDGYDISFTTNKVGNLSAVFRFSGMTARAPYKVSENHVIINFSVLYDGGYYTAQFNGNIFDFLEEDIQNYLTSLNRIPYTYPYGGSVVDLSDMHRRMIAYLLNNKAKESMIKLEGNYRNINFLEESDDGYLKNMLEGFRFVTNKQLNDSKSYIYYPTDNQSWNYSINSKQIANIVVKVPDTFKIKRTTQSEDDWKSYKGDQILEQYLGSDENLSVPMGVTMVKLIQEPANTKVTTLTLPESVHTIDQQSIAKYLKNLKAYAYEDPKDARSISNANYQIIDGVLYSADGTTLLSVPPGRDKKLVIPSTVTTLAKDCFKNVSLDKIYFEDEVPPTLLGDTGYQGTIIVPASSYDHVCKNYMFSFEKECENIKFLLMDSEEEKYKYDLTTNTICSKNNEKVLCAIPRDAKGLYTVDSKYETIDGGAFYGNTTISDIDLNENVKYLNSDCFVFSDLNKIQTISCKYHNLTISSSIFGNPSDGSTVPDIKIYVNGTDYNKYLESWTTILDPKYGDGTVQKLLSLKDQNIIYEDGAKYQKYMDGTETKYRLLQVYETDKTAFKIKDGTTQITENAFNDCKKLEILDLPSTLQSIDQNVLKDCQSLETVFSNYADLNLSIHGVSVFHSGIDYQEFIYENGVVYGRSVDNTYTLLNVPTDFSGVFSLKENTSKLYDKAFYQCDSITDFVVPDPTALKEIGTSCFEDNKSCKSLDFSQFTNLTIIGKAAFKNCTKLSEIKLPDQLQNLEDQTFYGCVDLENIKATGIAHIKNEVFAECLILKDLIGFDNLQTIGDLAFYDCQTMQTAALPDSVTKIGEECFENCLSLRKITLNGSLSAISRYCFYGCEKLAEISMSENQKKNLKVIGVEAFAECKDLKNIDFSDLTALTQIGESAFENCSEMVSMKLPESVEKLPTNCFSGCNNLSALQLNSKKAVKLENTVFGDTMSRYLHILVPETALSTYKDAYENNLDTSYGDGTTEKILDIIDSKIEYLKGIKYELTENGRILKSVSDDYEGDFTVLEDTIKIEDDAFKNCDKITKLIIPQDAKIELGNRCFKGCTNLKTVELYGDIPTWGDEVFMDCTNLNSVIIGYSISDIPVIGTRAFKGCSGLNSISAITISAHVNTIGKEAFMDCINLPAIGFTISSVSGDARTYLKTIDDRAFENCKSLTAFLTTKFSGVTKLGDYVFKGCSSLKQPSLSASVISIGTGCFMDCENLLYVSFYGAIKEYPKDCFKNCPKLIRTGGTATAFNALRKIGESAYEGCSSLTSSTSWYLERYANLEEIGDLAFKDCKTLSASTLSATVNTIGNHAFDGCTNMNSLTLKGTIPPVINEFSLDSMMEGFMFKVPDSKESDDDVYKAYFEQLKEALGNEAKVYPILDSISDGAKDRNIPKEEVTANENESQNNEETNE